MESRDWSSDVCSSDLYKEFTRTIGMTTYFVWVR